MKVCTKCGAEKDVEEFGWCNPRPGERYRRTYCKVCANKQHQLWRHKHVASWLEFLESEGIRIKCRQCRFGDKDSYAALQFHHIVPSTKEGMISTFIQKYSTEHERVPEILRTIKEDCVILCANCHSLLHAGKIELNI